MNFRKRYLALVQHYKYNNGSKIVASVDEELLVTLDKDKLYDFASCYGVADVNHQDKDTIGEFRDVRYGLIRHRITLYDEFYHYHNMCKKYGLDESENIKNMKILKFE